MAAGELDEQLRLLAEVVPGLEFSVDSQTIVIHREGKLGVVRRYEAEWHLLVELARRLREAEKKLEQLRQNSVPRGYDY
jgi:hypothetical protein